MTRIDQNRTMGRKLRAIPIFLLLTLIGNVGCSFARDQVLAIDLENRVASHGTADDHIAAALLYQQQAHQAQTEADKYEQAAASIRPIEDPKGFRRNALMTAAQEHQRTAGEMQQLYAAHEAKSKAMLGKQQPQ